MAARHTHFAEEQPYVEMKDFVGRRLLQRKSSHKATNIIEYFRVVALMQEIPENEVLQCKFSGQLSGPAQKSPPPTDCLCASI